MWCMNYVNIWFNGSVDTSAEKADELDKALIQLEHGIDIAMQVCLCLYKL